MNHFKVISILLIVHLISAKATATVISLSFDDFFASAPEVSVSSTNVSFTESPTISLLTLVNDPFLGDPNIIIPNTNRVLSFDYNFIEAANNNDLFGAYLFDVATFQTLSEIEFDHSSTGTASFDLSSYVGLTLGLSFELFDISGNGDTSSLLLQNLRLIDTVNNTPIPEPIYIAFLGFAILIRRHY